MTNEGFKVRRYKEWATLMDEGVESKRFVKFNRDGADCLHQVCDIIKLYTGRDLLEKYRGTYKTDKEALKIIRKFDGGLRGLLEFHLEEELGLVPIVPKWAGRGDIAYIHQDNLLLQGLGLFVGGGVFAPSQEKGFNIIPRANVTLAWHIPFYFEVY